MILMIAVGASFFSTVFVSIGGDDVISELFSEPAFRPLGRADRNHAAAGHAGHVHRLDGHPVHRGSIDYAHRRRSGLRSGMVRRTGDGEPADLVSHPAVCLFDLLSQGHHAARGQNHGYLSRGIAVRGHPDRRHRIVHPVPVIADHAAGSVNRLRGYLMTIHQSSPERVTLFIQCIVDGVYPEVAEAMVRIFDCLGIAVDYPTGQTCCGQPAFNSGYRTRLPAKRPGTSSRSLSRRRPSSVPPAPAWPWFATTIRSCLRTIRPGAPGAVAVAERTFELTEFLVDVLGVTDLGARYPGRATYHDSCHLLRTLGVRSQPRALLAKVRGLEFVEMVDSDRCCGFGGTFSVKYPEISTAMVAEKVANILATGADTVVGCDMACLMNIEGYLSRHNHPVKVKHIAQLLAP